MKISITFLVIWALALGPSHFVFSYLTSHGAKTDPWFLPVLPRKMPPVNRSHDKLIPRYLWMAVREIEDIHNMNAQLPALFERNKNWELKMVDNYNKDVFMNKTFANTSLLWAYHAISPAAGAAKADIWRYAVLWTYGGFYIDDDSDMKVPLDNMVEPLDEMIISFEKNGFDGDVCYIPKYHLSDWATFRNETHKARSQVFNGNVVPNWALAAAPGHPFLARTMKNIVEVLRHEYLMDPVMRDLKFAFKWMSVMCATGPYLMTASAREVIMENPPGLKYKLANCDFRDYGGKFKAIRVLLRNDPNHYMNKLEKGQIRLLSSYMPEPPVTKEQLKSWEGEAVQGQNSKEIFVINDGKKRGIPNYDTLLALNFTMAAVRVITDAKLEMIPRGDSMPKMDYQWPN